MRAARPEDCLAIGVDLVALSHFTEFLRRNQSDLEEIFTERELAEAQANRRDLYLATRWALKEAAFKALGTGWSAGVQWTDVEALGSLTAPQISLHGRAKRLAEAAGATSLTGSAGCAGECVIAFVALGA